MKLYAGFAPNAFRVLAFMHEKNLDLPIEQIDVLKGEARKEDHLKRNSLGEIPVLELDDGSYLSESIAICRYLESLHPEVPLMGENALNSARIEMWNRRMEQQIMGPYSEVGLHAMPIFADKIEQIPEYAESQRRLTSERWAWFNEEMSDGRAFVAGDTFTVADITGMTALMISGFLDLDVPSDLRHANRWVNAVKARPSWLRYAKPV